MYHYKDITKTKQQNKASLSIQKYLKGLIIAKQYEEFYVKMRLTDNLGFFKGMKDKIYDDAQILIAYHWRKKIKRIKKAKMKSPGERKIHAKKKSI